jgi:hypothetical protein
MHAVFRRGMDAAAQKSPVSADHRLEVDSTRTFFGYLSLCEQRK